MDDYTAHRQNEQCFISYLIIMKKLPLLIAFVFVLAIILQWCTSNLTPEKVAEMNENPSTVSNSQTKTRNVTQTKWAIYSSSDLFTDRDLEQTPDLKGAKYYTVSDWEDITITEEWVYVLQWTAKNVTVFVEDFQKHIIIPRSCNILFQILLYHIFYTSFYWLFPIHTYYET